MRAFLRGLRVLWLWTRRDKRAGLAAHSKPWPFLKGCRGSTSFNFLPKSLLRSLCRIGVSSSVTQATQAQLFARWPCKAAQNSKLVKEVYCLDRSRTYSLRTCIKTALDHAAAGCLQSAP